MDPFILLIGGVAAYEWMKSRRDRKLAEWILQAWDEGLKRRRGAPGKRIRIPAPIRDAIWIRDGRCVDDEGSDDCDKSQEVDHQIPLKHGGNNYSNNLVARCHRHNLRKRTKLR